MKKLFLMLVIAVSAIALVSCAPENDNCTYSPVQNDVEFVKNA